MQEPFVPGYFAGQGFGIRINVRMEDIRPDDSVGEGPVTDDLSVRQDHRPEDAPLIMGLVPVVGMQGNMAALVADEVFIIGWKKVQATTSESAYSGISMEV